MRTLAALVLVLAGPAAADVVVRPGLALTGTGTVAATATVPAGERLVVVLPGQPGTGYAWEPRPADPALLAPVEAPCEAGPADGRVGGVVPACFAWRAVAPGEATVTLVYRRHWEANRDGVLRYDLTVTVR